MTRQVFIQMNASSGKRRFLDMVMLVFLLGNLVIRFTTIFHYPPYDAHIAAFLGCFVAACIGIIFFQRFLKAFLFIFGFSFFLFGFPSMDMQSRIFEIIVTCVATTLFIINWRSNQTHGLNRHLVVLVLCYVFLSLFSLVLMPLRQIFKDFWLFGFPDFFFYVFIAQPYNIYYPIPAITRLILYVILAVQLASLDSRNAYKTIFLGLFSGGVFCAFIGFLDFYGLISLQWYRFGRTATPGVLHSTFGNRGVFGEFILTVVPFVLIGFISGTKKIWMQILLFGSLVICEIALILAGARAGWVSYPLILIMCWLFFYFSNEGGMISFHFRWKDLVKVAISVPITIVISVLLIFQVLMPLSAYLSPNAENKGIQKDAEATRNYLKGRASHLIDPGSSGRLYTWAEGYDVGMESPLFGMGYESFCWHAHVLADFPESDLGRFYQVKGKFIHFTPHNIFFQLFTSGGIVGLSLWLLIVGYAMIILLFDLIRNKRLLNIPVIISIISFHVYGLFQSMQYISMVWALIFLNLGYAMTVDEKVLPERVRRVMGIAGKIAMLSVAIGFFVYLTNFESRTLAKKYDKRIYAMDQDRDRFAGFFQPLQTKPWNYGDYRWFGKKGTISIAECGVRNAEFEKRNVQMVGEGKDREPPRLNTLEGNPVPSGRGAGCWSSIELEFHCRTPGLEEDPVVLKVFHEGRVLDEIVFSTYHTSTTGDEKKGKKKKTGCTVRRRYDLPVTPGENRELLLEVSKTWIPHEHLKNFDRRNLGIGVKILKG